MIPAQSTHRWLHLAALACCTLLSGAPVVAQPAKLAEPDVKAAYLLNFARFATWPAGEAAADSASFPVCVLGRDPFGQALDTAVAGELIRGRSVVAKRIAKPQEAAGCGILFISASESARIKQVLAAIEGAPTLTVSDMPRFVEQDGMIQFVPAGNRVRFAVNVTAAERAGLAFSSELLRVAVAIHGKPGAW